ncbi:MAG: 23S rRNA (guanosine(2251)-2'-O)-methyltransferase RlmB [Algicola sp.]|nr:23S rRNA (guanosine(2251)-2'-O)-methyltransferase RlmB [Algicola sp.]
MSSKSELIFGLHAVEAVLQRQPERIIEIYALKGRQDDRLVNIINAGRQQGISVQFMARKVLDNKSDDERHQGVMARVKPAAQLNETDLAELLEKSKVPPFLLILDGVTDPHNLGACMRSADAAGVTAIIVPKDNASKITPTVQKVACGAADTVPFIQVTNLARTMRFLQDEGIWIIGTAGETDKNLYQTEFKGPIALAMGAEGSGLRRLTREHCDELIKIPMAGSVSSLNVSVATGVCLFEVIRQRQL